MEICRKNLENIFSLERENPVIYLGIQLLDPSDSCINYKGQMCICRYKEDSSGSPTLFTPRDGKFPVRQISHGDLYFVNVQLKTVGDIFVWLTMNTQCHLLGPHRPLYLMLKVNILFQEGFACARESCNNINRT